MKRIDFLKQAGVGLFSLPLLVAACKEAATTIDPTTSTAGSTNGSSAANCTVTNTETAGPFPTKNPSSYAMQNIVGNRTGLPLTVNITVKNKNTGCQVLSNVVVDIWHCDAAGAYSQYGGTGMQSANYTAENWLRGRQTTNADGVASYKTIFPGWYPGRAPHIHVHIYASSGASLLVTQIAFPKTVCDAVYSSVTNFYTKGLQDTTNERDNIFSDGVSNELATLTGNTTDGYVLSHTIVVNA